MNALHTFINLVPVGLVQGLLYGLVALAIMLPMRMLDFPDLTSEGSFPLGSCVCAALLIAGWHPLSATLAAMAAGALAGSATAMIHNTTKANTLLCGVIVFTMIYSLNIRIMGQPNLPLFTQPTLLSMLLGEWQRNLLAQLAFFGGLNLCVAGFLTWFLRTQIGTAMRAVGANAEMAQAQGVNVAAYKVVGLGLANMLAALAGSLYAQNQGFADVNLGFGVLINGLAALMLGEALLGHTSLLQKLSAPIAGALLYHQLVSLTLAVGLQPSDLKLATGLFVLIALLFPAWRDAGKT